VGFAPLLLRVGTRLPEFSIWNKRMPSLECDRHQVGNYMISSIERTASHDLRKSNERKALWQTSSITIRRIIPSFFKGIGKVMASYSVSAVFFEVYKSEEIKKS